MVKIPFSIKTRLTFWYLIVITTLLAFWGFAAYLLLSNGLKQGNMNPPVIRIWYIDNQGNNVAASGNLIVAAPSPQDLLMISYSFTVQKSQQPANENSYLTLITQGGPIIVNQQPISANLSEGTFVWVYLYQVEGTSDVYRLMTFSQSGVVSLLSSFARALLISLPAAVILAGLLGFFLLRTMMRPIDLITDTAEEISGKNLSRRLEISSQDELGRLAATMNRMFERLEGAFKREKQFTADVSHELGTPLSIIHGEAELALQNPRSGREYEKTLATILAKTKHISSIIHRLLFLARDESNQNLRIESVNLTGLLTDIKQDAEVLGESKNIRVRFDYTNTVFVRGDQTLLRELFLNIIDNAVKYTPSGGMITISVAEQDGNAALSIADTGIGISAEHLPNIFKRFYTVDQVRSSGNGGSGLGLSICQRIAEFHSGKITVDSELGKGSVFKVFIPMIDSMSKK